MTVVAYTKKEKKRQACPEIFHHKLIESRSPPVSQVCVILSGHRITIVCLHITCLRHIACFVAHLQIVGGLRGFDKVVWDVVERKDGKDPSITFQYHSKDGEEGFPGDVVVRATYSLPEPTTLRLDMEAIAENKATPISLAQHTYWNLAGHNSGDTLGHSIQIWGKYYTPVDENSIPTGEIVPVKDTPFDFTTLHKVGARINDVPGGYDHNYVLDCGDEKNGLKLAAKLKDPSTSRTLNLWTDAPGMQFYTANYVDGITGKGGAVYEKHSAVCLETQGFPNAINQPNFPSVVVQPGEKYKHTMLFEFSA